jgi:hypothetical protein
MGGFGEVEPHDHPLPGAPPDGTPAAVVDESDMDIDAYIFVHGATQAQINQLRLLVDNDYRYQCGLEPEPRVDASDDDKTVAANVKAQIDADGNSAVRSVIILAGKYDAVVAVTAAGFRALERLVLIYIHQIISTTETNVALYPPPRHPAPRKPAADGAGAAQSPSGSLPPISEGRGGGGVYGPTWGPHDIFRAVLQIAALPDVDPQTVADDLKTKFTAGDLYRGASVVAGDLNVLAMLGSNRFTAVRDGLLQTLHTVTGVARVTVSLNFQEIPPPTPGPPP